jgi:hypothetical protein
MNGSNPKRMYVLENTRGFARAHALPAGATLAFYAAPDRRLVRAHLSPSAADQATHALSHGAAPDRRLVRAHQSCSAARSGNACVLHHAMAERQSCPAMAPGWQSTAPGQLCPDVEPGICNCSFILVFVDNIGQVGLG